MPPRVPSIQALRALHARLQVRPYRSCSCSRRVLSRHARSESVVQFKHQLFWPTAPKLRASDTHLARFHNCPLRQVAHAVPAISINAKATVPARFKELHAALRELETAAEIHAPLTQLQLALGGLEAEDAVIRAGISSIGGVKTASRLARVLVADPLGPKQEWEDVLLEDHGDKAILIRHGEDFLTDDRNPFLRIIAVPATFLRRHKLELLVSSTQALSRRGRDEDAAERESELLRVELGTRSSGARPGTIFETHKALVLGEAMQGARGLLGIVGDTSYSDADLVHGGVNLNLRDLSTEPSQSKLTLFNISEAEAAIAAFRESLSNSTKYEHSWLGSNVEAASTFLTAGTAAEESPLKPILKTYIDFVLSRTSQAIAIEESQRQTQLSEAVMPAASQASLRSAIEAWAELGHIELRDALTNALRSATWRKLAWWKLLWRVDDVGLLTNDILQRAYLVNTEKHLLWIGGYFRARGLILAEGTDGHHHINETMQPKDNRWLAAVPSNSEVGLMYEDYTDLRRQQQLKSASNLGSEDTVVEPPTFSSLNPWPQQIAQSRAKLQALVPPLQLRAQMVLLRTLSLTGLSGALGALAYVNVADASVYGAGSIVALGTAFSFKAAQSSWELAKKEWIDATRAEGKGVLERIEKRGKDIITEEVAKAEAELVTGGDGAGDRERARAAIERVREALDKL